MSGTYSSDQARPQFKWIGNLMMAPWNFTCGYCNKEVCSEKGISAIAPHASANPPVPECNLKASVYICPNCSCATFRDTEGTQTPQPKYGRNIMHLPDEVHAIYEEARASMQAGAYTGAISLCRSILAHVAKNLGSQESTFKTHIGWLDTEGYIPKNTKGALEWIRERGNESVHDLAVFKKPDCMIVLDFTMHMLETIYEYPNKISGMCGKSTLHVLPPS